MIPFIIKSGLMLSLFYAFFILFMKRNTFFRFNRVMFLTGTAICMCLPLLNFNIPIVTDTMPHLVIPEAAVSTDMGKEGTVHMDWRHVVLTLYLLGASAVLAMTVISLTKTCAAIRKGSHMEIDGHDISLLDENISSFSFFDRIVISKRDFDNYPMILQHELAHVRHLHSFDLLFVSIVTIIHWFNPLIWMARSELMMLHEYEADETVINQGIDATQYQLLLVKKAVGSERFLLANGLNHAKLKNRITMMNNKTKSNKWSRLAYLAMLPVLASAFCFCTNQKEGQKETSEIDQVNVISYGNENAAPKEEAIPFTLLNDKPSFNDGDVNEFSKWVIQKLVYPQSAKDAGEQGRILVSFEITAEGKMSNVRILRGVSKALDEEALRVVKSSPDWTPGKKDGKPVPVTYTIPIEFTLR